MKRLICTLIAVLFTQNVFALETIEGKPTKKYSVISPISSNKSSVEKSFADLQKKAEKMGADALINWSCTAPEAINQGLLKIRAFGSSASCQGTAVKWQ